MLQIPGGWLATRIGGTRIFGAALFFASLLTLLTPFAARYSVYALITLRVLEGVALVSFHHNLMIIFNLASFLKSGELVLVSILVSNFCFDFYITHFLPFIFIHTGSLVS